MSLAEDDNHYKHGGESNNFAAEPRDAPGLLAGRLARLAASLRSTHLGLGTLAIAVGIGSGFGAVGFRWLIFAFTWIATGREQFGQQGRVESLTFPGSGVGSCSSSPSSVACSTGL